MNNPRRKALNKLKEKLSEIKDQIEEIRDEEEEYRDNIPENLWGSERYDKAEMACDELMDCLDSIEAVIENMENAVEN